MTELTYQWNDRKRYFGLPLSFTKYALGEDRLFLEKGFFNLNADEVLLYRVRDLELNISLGQRIFGVGTVRVHSSDHSIPLLELENIKKPRVVKEMIHQAVEQAKDKRRMRAMEIMGGSEGDGSIRQSGGIQFRLADSCDDADLMETAFADARSLLEQDATLSGYPVLRERMERMFTVDASVLN